MGNGQSADAAVAPEVMAKCTLPPEAVKALIKAFRKHTSGKNSKGSTVWRQDFYTVLAALPPHLRGDSILFDNSEVLFDTLDTNHGGTLDLDELLLGLSVLATGTMEEKATLTFKAMDADNSGSLNQDEVKKQCEKLYKMLKTMVGYRIRSVIRSRYGNSVPNQVLDAAMDQALANMRKGLIDDGPAHILAQGDTDGDNQLSLEEWLALVKKNELAQWLVSPEPYVKQVVEDVVPAMVALMPARS